MRVLYCAIDQTVPGTKGGSVHVEAVARGLAALGHEVTVLTGRGYGPFPAGDVTWIPMRPPLGMKELRWMRTGAVTRLAHALRPDVVIERYYNFGGEGISAARAVGAAGMLEVNAPVVDHPGSRKAALDRALLVRPMRRWRERLCAHADVIVTPSADILPPGTPRDKVVEAEWGADTDRFRPGVTAPLRLARPAGVLVVFAGAFRAWHGAVHLVRAVKLLRERGHRDISAMLIGDGPELPRVRAEAANAEGIVFTGPVPHEEMPAYLGAADIGAAPFDVAAHAPLSLGFFWSPLKIFEYMAAGLPVVAPAVDRIPSLVRHDREGLLYSPAGHGPLAEALVTLGDPVKRARMGNAARERVVAEYSWSAHCRILEAALERALDRRPART